MHSFEVGTEIRLELVECGLTLGSATGLEDNPQSMHLAAPHGVTVNDLGIAVQRLHIGVQSIHFILASVGNVAYSGTDSGEYT